jgi:hypothetical protein
MRARFSASHAVAALSLSLYVSACGGAQTPDPEPAPPPPNPVDATGNGELVSATLGPSGGRLHLSKDGPSIEIPVDAARKDGVSISLRKGEPFAPPSGVLLGESFRVTLALDPPSGGSFSVFSAAMAQLPAGCTETNVELGVERPNSAGPSDGANTLEWEYVPATFVSSHAASKVPRFWPHRMQFLCARAP